MNDISGDIKKLQQSGWRTATIAFSLGVEEAEVLSWLLGTRRPSLEQRKKLQEMVERFKKNV